jgi:hypothetical protein
MLVKIIGAGGYIGLDEVVGKVVDATPAGKILGKDLIEAGATFGCFDEHYFYFFCDCEYIIVEH